MNNKIQIYKDYIDMLINNHINSILCYSKAGYGKTYTTINELNNKNVEYIYVSGITTAVALYKLLYDNRNKIIVIDDVETIFQDDRIINILKAALWKVGNKRVISYKTSSVVLEDYPDSFTYNGKIIILANEIKGKNDESFNAVISRCLKYNLNYSFDEIIDISINIITNKKDLNKVQKNKIIDIIENIIKPEHNFNFRLLEQLISFTKYDINKCEILFLNSININDDIKILRECINKHITVEEQINEFKNRTGKSRMTFFRLKKKI
jgi:hypothetical protein